MAFRILICISLGLLGGPCLHAQSPSQARHRNLADREVRSILEEKAASADWETGPGTLETDIRSRFHDPSNPDQPARPPDDPESELLMQRVDGKRGVSWHDAGTPSPVESGIWREFLPMTEQGEVLLSLENAVRLALLHSRRYQLAREELYLSALDVTEQRFRFDTQPAFNSRGDRFEVGPKSEGEGGDRTTLDSRLSMTQSLPSGADLVAGLANSVLWDLSSGSETLVSSVMNFGLVQPLLRFRAREFVLEELTQSERDLLGNVRRMKQFQQGFYIDVVSGEDITRGPSRGGVGGETAPLVAGSPASIGSAGGFLGLLQRRQQIRNQESSVAALQDSLAQLQAAFDAGRIGNRLQVDQARQALYDRQSSLLTSYASFDSSVDSYKVTLGLPPGLDVDIEDKLLDPFNLVDSNVSALQGAVVQVLDRLRRGRLIPDQAALVLQIDRLLALEPRILAQLESAYEDTRTLRAGIPNRDAQMAGLKDRPELQSVYMDAAIFDVEGLQGLPDRLVSSIDDLKAGLAALMGNLRVVREVEVDPEQLDRARQNVVGLASGLSSYLLELSLIHASARLEAVSLLPIEIEFDEAFRFAEENRLDWMNARAGLVDSWRQVAVDAEALKTGLNLIVNGQVPTLGNDAFNFSRDAGRLQLGLQIDSPLRRLSERNDYRESLIAYQRSRRGYMLFEDQIGQSLRNTLRTVRLSQLNFEVRRAAVRIAVAQVDLARLRLNQPPRPGEGGAQFGATTARDLVSALGDLLSAQNDFLDVWVGYEILRMLLDYELGTMQLEEGGLWDDPGPITAARLAERLAVRAEMNATPVVAATDGKDSAAAAVNHRGDGPVQAGRDRRDRKEPAWKGILTLFRREP